MCHMNMSRCFCAALCALLLTLATGAEPQGQGTTTPVPPQWAYGFKTPLGSPPASEPAATPSNQLAKDDGKPVQLPGSPLSLTFTQMRSAGAPVDWYPNDHPQMPEVVARNRPGVSACGSCHYPNGKGDTANASISALPYVYFVQTMEDFRKGLRKSADPRKYNTDNMIAYAKAMTDEEIRETAEYFAAIPFTSRVKVVESQTVPKTRLVAAGVYFALEGNETEPLGDRIIEMPETANDFIYRDSRSSTVAYVPVGSIKKGERLVTTGGDGKTTQCAICHGPDLLGLGPVPGIAGRGPSYLVRQLFDMQHGYRKGVWTSLMKPAVEKLSADDIIDIVAYLSSRKVVAAPAPR
jgi:cytochrome c553